MRNTYSGSNTKKASRLKTLLAGVALAGALVGGISAGSTSDALATDDGVSKTVMYTSWGISWQ